MKNKKYIIGLFLLLAIVQIFVPLKMIFEQENILAKGIIMKFKTQPIDPADPFRGKYVQLNFAAETIYIKKNAGFSAGETIFAIFENDASAALMHTILVEQFAHLKNISFKLMHANNRGAIIETN